MSTRLLVETRVSELRAGDLWLYDGAWVLLTEVTPAAHPDDRVQLLYRQENIFGQYPADSTTEEEFTNPRGNEAAVVKREPASTDRPFMVWEGSLENLRAWIGRWVASSGDYTLLPRHNGATDIMMPGVWCPLVRPGDRIVRTEPVQGYAGIAVVNHS